jgi:hypothetical protein
MMTSRKQKYVYTYLRTYYTSVYVGIPVRRLPRRGAGIFGRHAHVRRHSRYSWKLLSDLLPTVAGAHMTWERNREAYSLVISLWLLLDTSCCAPPPF